MKAQAALLFLVSSQLLTGGSLLCQNTCFLSLVFVSFYGKTQAKPEPLLPAPQWQLLDANGQAVSSKGYEGQPLVIYFWAIWCPYCQKSPLG
jgi:thiol-disulfide isomerase/thioredoxin